MIPQVTRVNGRRVMTTSVERTKFAGPQPGRFAFPQFRGLQPHSHSSEIDPISNPVATRVATFGHFGHFDSSRNIASNLRFYGGP